jgi:hypothetical protein
LRLRPLELGVLLVPNRPSSPLVTALLEPGPLSVHVESLPWLWLSWLWLLLSLSLCGRGPSTDVDQSLLLLCGRGPSYVVDHSDERWW